MTDQKSKNSFLSILNTWPEYYENMDEGLGTTYERFILHRYFERIHDNFQISSVLEAPAFGMTGVSGINSLWWAAQGIRPMVLDNNNERISLSKEVWDSIPLPADLRYVDDFYRLPFGNKAFDFSWNFASIWFVDNLELFLTELDRVTTRTVFICIPNRLGIGYRLRAYLNKPIPDVLHPDNIRASHIIKIMQKLSWKLWDDGYLDIPPWPDIAMKKEDLLGKAGLGFLLNKKGTPENPQHMCIVDHFNGKSPALDKQVLKYSFLEGAPFPVKQLWAHHRYLIFAK